MSELSPPPPPQPPSIAQCKPVSMERQCVRGVEWRGISFRCWVKHVSNNNLHSPSARGSNLSSFQTKRDAETSDKHREGNEVRPQSKCHYQKVLAQAFLKKGGK